MGPHDPIFQQLAISIFSTKYQPSIYLHCYLSCLRYNYNYILGRKLYLVTFIKLLLKFVSIVFSSRIQLPAGGGGR